ncbi:hypothetical protein IWZ03DRAFT_379153 [Phyllosticta citriasiana]|uniref:Uncharacterized protein n=1 Tax=Phyllosticta citriasiana TaxID=595635 RepID=A0ABR1KR38_9PEZI
MLALKDICRIFCKICAAFDLPIFNGLVSNTSEQVVLVGVTLQPQVEVSFIAVVCRHVVTDEGLREQAIELRVTLLAVENVCEVGAGSFGALLEVDLSATFFFAGRAPPRAGDSAARLRPPLLPPLGATGPTILIAAFRSRRRTCLTRAAWTFPRLRVSMAALRAVFAASTSPARRTRSRMFPRIPSGYSRGSRMRVSGCATRRYQVGLEGFGGSRGLKFSSRKVAMSTFPA